MKKIYLEENELDQEGHEYQWSTDGVHPVCGCIYNDFFLEHRRYTCDSCSEEEFWETFQRVWTEGF